MRRIRLKVAYDGTAYKGWQIQQTGISIEYKLNEALQAVGASITKKNPAQEPFFSGVIGASRTDSGVHALGNIAVFDTDTRIPAEKFAAALNQRLPEDIRILESEEVAGDWHPRYQETRKTYEYRVYHAAVGHPMKRLYSHFVHYRLDIPRMREAAALLVGEHDFRSFCNPESQVLERGGSTVRRIDSIELIEETEDMLVIRVQGNGFLYHMIRILAGTLLKIGMHLAAPEDIPAILEKRERRYAGPTAPACGLTLVEISYPGEHEPDR